MTRTYLKYFGAGLVLALCEIVLTLARGYGLFLTTRERAEYALAALSALPLCVALLGLVLERACAKAERARRVRAFLSLAWGGLSAYAGYVLTEGRRVRDLSYRPGLVLAFALVAAAALWWVLRAAAQVAERSQTQKQLFALALMLAALLCLGLDAWVLPRGYPAFHYALFVVSVLCAALSVAPISSEALFVEPRLASAERRLALGAALLTLLTPWALYHLARQPNASYASTERAPFTAKLLKPWLRVPAPAQVDETVAVRAGTARFDDAPKTEGLPAGVDLRDREVLLITVDALRADLLRAHGGSGLTPEIDKLAAQSLLFRHAYTVAPHTSYALASLLTAKFIKPVTELESAAQDHKTLPDLLRRYGYRTAAFYPPAVFYVDGARFRALADRSFGFEYKKEMFASADQRVAQLESYLAEADAKRPLFIWMHLFEPHEPYDPPSELKTADTARGRYEGEVRAADRAIGELVRVFRAARPRGTVIVSADHGEEFGDHGGSYHGTTLFEEQVHVPLLWSSPGVVKPGVSDVPVELVDVGSTILSTAGVPRDARMRGDDLSPVLAGAVKGPKYAFASVDEQHMVMDGRYKALCSPSSEHCQLFDLAHDPKEQRNLAGQDPKRAAELRRALFQFLSSIAQREVMAVEQGVSMPEPLVRARLGAPGAGADVVPLLSDTRPSVRAASARVLGELGIASAVSALIGLSTRDPDASVRDEASIAALALGAAAVHAQVAALLARDQEIEARGTTREQHAEVDGAALSLKRRAALSLALRGDARAAPWLSAWLSDATAQESERLRVVAALGKLGGEQARSALVLALSEVRLREASAQALAQIGGQVAADALFSALSEERYEPARAAEAKALIKLGDKRVVAQIERFLGMETSLPDGVRMLLELGQLRQPSARGASVLSPGARRGTFACDAAGCVPGAGARLVIGARVGSRKQRITVLVSCGEQGATLTIADRSYRCAGGEQQLSFPRGALAQELPVASTGRVTIHAWVSLPEVPEIPPPAPEPWDAGSAVDAAPAR
jgi:arylsulfatase A-like enzyme